jgi:hypothetical protein
VIEFHHLALNEVRQAVAWYRAKSPRTAERFVEHVAIVVDRALKDPESHPTIGGRFRYIRIRNFPFILVYEIRGKREVFVVALAHTSRRAAYWRRMS